MTSGLSNAMQRPRLQIPRWAASTAIPGWLVLGLCLVAGLHGYGLYLMFTAPRDFFVWIREDGLLERLTVAWLVVAAIVSARHAWRSGGERPGRASVSVLWVLVALMFLFGALEEISYGQRIFGSQTPSWLHPPPHGSEATRWIYNRQDEHNIHNLVVFGVNINKLIFGKGMFLVVLAYFGALPLLYRISKPVRTIVNRLGLPVPQLYQIALLAVVAGTTIPFQHLHEEAKKVAEIMEFSGSYIAMMTLSHPGGGAAMQPGAGDEPRREIATGAPR